MYYIIKQFTLRKTVNVVGLTNVSQPYIEIGFLNSRNKIKLCKKVDKKKKNWKRKYERYVIG